MSTDAKRTAAAIRDEMAAIQQQISDLHHEANLLGSELANTQLAENPADIITCPSRMSQMGPWEHKENLDRWERVGADRACSFCGSMHPDDLNVALDDENTGIGISDKRYKVYIQRPTVSNAKEGAIEYYTWHRPVDDATATALLEKLNAIAKRTAAKQRESWRSALSG